MPMTCEPEYLCGDEVTDDDEAVMVYARLGITYKGIESDQYSTLNEVFGRAQNAD